MEKINILESRIRALKLSYKRILERNVEKKKYGDAFRNQETIDTLDVALSMIDEVKEGV